MNAFREYVRQTLMNESPIAVVGDWDGFKDNKSIHIAKRGFDKGLYEIVGKTFYNNKPVIICREKRLPDLYFFGSFGKETESSGKERDVFIAFAQLKTLKRDDLKSQIGYNNPIQTSKIEVFDNRLKGIAKTFYKWFIDNDYTLISDMVQYDGARKLWDSLSREPSIICDIIDDQRRSILKHNTRVESGEDFWDFDTKLWSYDFDKAHIRFAIYKK